MLNIFFIMSYIIFTSDIYIGNDINSVIIEIKISDNDTTYKMETLYNGGMPTFIQYYGDISFECTKIEYNKSGRVSFMIFEQKTS